MIAWALARNSTTFNQHVGATDPLRAGAYSKALVFTLTTTTP